LDAPLWLFPLCIKTKQKNVQTIQELQRTEKPCYENKQEGEAEEKAAFPVANTKTKTLFGDGNQMYQHHVLS